MELNTYKKYIQILNEELVPAMGCTEPIAIAYAAAKAREVLGAFPERVVVKCSGNMIKNARCVTVPNTGDLVGIEGSAIIGILDGKASRRLEVINEVSEDAIIKAHELAKSDYCKIEFLDSDIELHIIIEVHNGQENAEVEIKYAHDNISLIRKNGNVIFKQEEDSNKYLGIFIDRSILTVEKTYEFSKLVKIDDIKELLDIQIKYNINIANEGLKGNYGVGIGKVIMQSGNSLVSKIKAYTAAASEARMSGCSLPVVTNSGSGNSGMTVSVPLIIYAKENNISQEMLYRGLVFANLINIHQKAGIGRLSAFCGAVTSGCASGAGITYLEEGTLEQINKTINNTLANISGIVCDGAKASCAAKIATSLDAAMMSHSLAMINKSYSGNTGILKENIEDTISAIGRLGKIGMRSTDKEILDIMLEA
ncbi:MAG: L-serine ammonia-lyase, iron-sulfur-dependent, subunit alpha [Clostridium sp.]|nr:L-serine ammonia-lyase, iron-sulfur-dependent, subunit alpha [Clostridium sp.]